MTGKKKDRLRLESALVRLTCDTFNLGEESYLGQADKSAF
jgi:hypothetical protein